MNKVFLIGNLTRDPELSETPNGVQLCRLGLAVSRDYKSGNGERETDFFNLTVWRERADLCARYLKKGNKIAVCGSIQNRSYEDKDGVKRTVTDIVVENVEFLTPRNSDESYDAETTTVKRQRPTLEAIEDDNQLPF